MSSALLFSFLNKHFLLSILRPLESASKEPLKNVTLIVCQALWVLAPGVNMFLWELDLLSRLFGGQNMYSNCISSFNQSSTGHTAGN